MIKVFIIDDSSLARNKIKQVLKSCKSIEIIGEAMNPVDAFIEFKKVGLPDLFILDLEMPKMDGLTFLKKIQTQKPIPTIIYSSYVENGSKNAIESLRLGACDIILKPKNNVDMEEFSDNLIEKIKIAVESKVITSPQRNLKLNKKDIVISSTNCSKVIAIGSSTGGVQTLEQIFTKLDIDHPPIVVVQHMPAGFTKSFANSLNNLCENSIVQEAKDGDILKNSHIFIAPGDIHIEIARKNFINYQIISKDYPKVSGHKPSVDVLFTSVSKVVKNDAIGFLLTGMGRDGAVGLKKIKEAKGVTYGQNEDTCIVYGMPKVAFEIGATSKQVGIEDIVKIINTINT